MRSILVHADNSPAGDVRIETALSLARLVRGHVTLLVDTPVGRFVTVDALGGGTVAAEAMREAITEDDEFARKIDLHLAQGDVPCDVLRAEAEPVNALGHASRLADVTVVSRADGLAGSLPMVSRAPVLAVNDDKPLRFPLEVACIGWDGSAEAAYALRCAVPILASCREVHVLMIDNEPTDFPAGRAMSYLSRHGITGQVQAVARVGSIEETLAREVRERGAQLLVMGAFHHSRLREYLFGGVTRHFLEDANGPALLLAH
jgi:nucleotide-binding universal stress UspA family protein